MSGDELADHLNRNSLTTQYGAKYEGKRGNYTLIKAIYAWLNEKQNLPLEAQKIAKVYVLPTAETAY